MAVAASAVFVSTPAEEGLYITLPASGTAHEINPGDYVSWSGNYIIATHTGVSYWKASGVGIACTRNPARDWAGRTVVNSAVVVATRGVFTVSAAFSGKPAFGTLAGPVMTGSGVMAASGVTGVGSLWNTASPVSVSGGTAAAPVPAVATVIDWENTGPAGTGQLTIWLWPRNADYY